MTPPNRPPLLPDDYTFVETEPYEKGFADYYREHILPLVMKYEPQRRIRNKTQYAQMALGLGAGFASSWLILKTAWFTKMAARIHNGTLGNLLFMPPVFFWWLLVRCPRRSFFRQAKDEIVPRILAFYDIEEYRAAGKFGDKTTRQHGLRSNHINAEDIISFAHDDVQIDITEVTRWELSGYKGELYICFTLPKPFHTEMAIISHDYFVIRNGYFARMRRIKSISKGLKKISVSDTRYQEGFDIYSEHAPITDIQLNRHFFDELKELDTALDKRGVLCSVRGNQMLVQMHTHHDLFEIARNFRRPVANVDDIKRFLKELDFVINITDMLTRRALILHGSYLSKYAKAP